MWWRSSGKSSSESLGIAAKLQSYCWLQYSFNRCTHILCCIFLFHAEYSKEKHLMMGIVVPETCWAYKKYNKIISSIYKVLVLQLSQWCTVQQTSHKRFHFKQRINHGSVLGVFLYFFMLVSGTKVQHLILYTIYTFMVYLIILSGTWTAKGRIVSYEF